MAVGVGEVGGSRGGGSVGEGGSAVAAVANLEGDLVVGRAWADLVMFLGGRVAEEGMGGGLLDFSFPASEERGEGERLLREAGTESLLVAA